jgi:prepilin-type N-terminal cleavage/methylation domain-containing protein
MPWKTNKTYRLVRPHGHTLIELLVVVIILSIITAVALNSLRTSNDVARTEKTRQAIERLRLAIAGNPALVSGGSRTDYGYVGDVGALPPSLGALVTNPGGYSTWRGPYIKDEFSTGGSDVSYQTDGWGATMSLSGVTISSTGGGSTISTRIAVSTDDLLRNQVLVTVTDQVNSPPGASYKDSVRALLTIPNGSGSTTTKSKSFAVDGVIQFDSIPIGVHLLRVVYAPTADTLRRQIAVSPGEPSYTTVKLYREVW